MKIIAEIGINHNGDIGLAKRLIDAARDAGCMTVKFQKRTIDAVYSSEYLDSPRKSPWGETQRAQKEGLEFGEEQYREIDTYCNAKGMEWFASSWDVESQKFLRKFDLKYNKVASAMLTNLPLLREIASEGKHTYIATGMSTWDEIDAAVAIFKDCPITLMHTNSVYPMPEKDANLAMMHTLRERYNVPVGYSGHEQGVLVSVIAYVMDATAIERHITLDRGMYGSDQAASILPSELKELVNTMAKVDEIKGDGQRMLTAAELIIREKLRPNT